MGLGQADSLRGEGVAGGNAQLISGWGMRGRFKSVQRYRSDLKSALRRLLPIANEASTAALEPEADAYRGVSDNCLRLI